MPQLTRFAIPFSERNQFSAPVDVLNVRTNGMAEWAWIAGRFALLFIAALGTAIFIRDTSAFGFLIGLIAVVALVNGWLAWNLVRREVRRVFLVGVVLDTVTVLSGWAVATRLLAGTEQTNDVYLILFPIIVAGVVRLGWPLGAAQALLFILWVGGVNVLFLEPSDYAVQQQPIRIAFLIATAGLTAILFSQLRKERERSEELWEESEALAGLGRIISSSPELDEVYQRFAQAVRRLIPFDRLSVSTVDESSGITLRYVEGDAVSDDEPAVSNLLEVSLTSYVMQSRLPIRVGVGLEDADQLPGMSSSESSTVRFRSSLSAPIIFDGQAIGALTLHSSSRSIYLESHERYLQRVADQVAGPLSTELSHVREMGFIEEQNRLEAENVELERVNEEKSKFLSTVSHELKTPLTSILAFTDILKRNKSGRMSERDVEHLTVIQRNGRRLSILIDDLVDVSRFDAGTLRISINEFDAQEMLHDVVQSFDPIFEGKNQSLSLITDEEPIWINADQARLAQVVTNLISNASKYSPEGSSVEVEVNVAGNRLGLAVRDNGKGISLEDQVNLFNPFFRVESDVESAVPGTGLGLAISSSIIDLHGGEITVESDLGRGAVFWISIPGVIEKDQYAGRQELQPADPAVEEAA